MKTKSALPTILYRRKIPLLAGCFSFSVLVIFFLYQVSAKINHEPNGFIRLFPPHLATPQKILDVQYNSFYIAGATPERIYLGNSSAPAYLITTNYSLVDTQHLRLKFQDKIKFYPEASVLTIDSSNLYLMEGKTPAVFCGKLSNLTLQLVRDSMDYFIGSLPISPKAFVLKVYDRQLRKTVLAKKMVSHSIFKAPEVLEKQVDGIFCTDGMMNYDPASNSLVYVYFYRNQFMRLDTSLNILYKGKTIDTTSHAKIKVDEIGSQSSVTMSAPPLTVNKRSCVSGDFVFINSGLLANNEIKKDFENCSVIDVYNLKDGEYQFSFYLPNYREKKINDFRVFGKTLVAMYDHYLFSYQLNF